MPNQQSRRSAIKNLVAGTAALGASSMLPALAADNENMSALKFKGNINHSVCRWCYNGLTVEELCKAVKKIGFSAIDLVGPKDWPMLQQYGIFSSMCNGAEINLTDGWAGKEFHP